MSVSGTAETIRGALTNAEGTPEDAVGPLTLLIVDPAGGEKTLVVKAGEIVHDGAAGSGLYHASILPEVVGLWHYRWIDAGLVAGEGTFEVESEFSEGQTPDLTDLRVMLPRARRKCEGPWGNPNNRPPLGESVLYNMIADACAEVVMLSGSFFHHQLLVKARDPLGGFPTRWKTDTVLSEYETAIITAQVALNYYYYLFRDMKISESIKNEGTEFSWSLSANAIRNYLESLRDERDRALAGLRVNIPVLDRFASVIRVRDQATVAVLEWFDSNSPGLTGGGLPGGQEATSIPWFPSQEG